MILYYLVVSEAVFGTWLHEPYPVYLALCAGPCSPQATLLMAFNEAVDTLHKNYASLVERTTETNQLHGTELQAQKTKPTKVSSKLWLLKWPRVFAL